VGLLTTAGPSWHTAHEASMHHARKFAIATSDQANVLLWADQPTCGGARRRRYPLQASGRCAVAREKAIEFSGDLR